MAETQIQPEILGVMPQEATDNLKLHFAAEWTRGVGEKSSEDCEITAQAVGYAQMGDTVLIGIEGNQILQLTASVVGTAVEPVLEKTRAAMFVDGTLETVEAEDFGSLTALPNNAFVYCSFPLVCMPNAIKSVGAGAFALSKIEGTVRCSPNINPMRGNWGSPYMKLDCTAYTYVPTLIKQEGYEIGTIDFKQVIVPSNLLNAWKNAPVWKDVADKIVAG